MSRFLSPKRVVALIAASLSAVLMSGCANFANTAGSSESAGTISGSVYGGSQIITGSALTLWLAGSSGYGSAPTTLATTTVNSSGGFSFGTYSCPFSNPNVPIPPMAYITAQGGVTGGQPNNPNIFLMVALGNCNTIKALSPHVTINENTTIAAMAALHNFASINSAGGVNIGSSSSYASANYGLPNAFATANNLVQYTEGQGQPFTVTGTVTGFTTSPSITVTPEVSKTNTEGNILASCVEVVANCTTLFADVNSTPALDTLQAAYYMQSNITSTVNGSSNIAGMFGLTTSTSPFQPTLSAAPADWTLGITYGSNSTNTAGQYFLSGAEYLAIDTYGNLWFPNYISGTVATNNSVSEISPAGVPLAQVLVGQIEGPAGIVIDPSNNVYVANYGTSSALQAFVTEYVSSTGATNTYTVDKGDQAIASDGQGNIFTLSPSYKGTGALDEIVAGTASGSTATQLANGITTDFSNLAIDSNYNVWINGGGTGALGGTSGYPAVFEFAYSAGSPHYPTAATATVTAGGVTAPENALAIDNSNNIFMGNYGKSTVGEFSGVTLTGATNAPYATQYMTTPEFGVMDGAGTFWVTNTVAAAGTVFGVSNTGTLITPVGTNAATSGLLHTYDKTYGIAVDGSGNIWVGNYSSAASATVQAYITEIVGAAVPVVTPLSAGLSNTPGGTSKLATKP